MIVPLNRAKIHKNVCSNLKIEASDKKRLSEV